MKQIKKFRTEEVLHEHGKTVKECAEHAVENEAELNFAKLSGAKLNGAELSGAKLNGAELNFAELNFAKLNDAKLNDAKLNGAELNFAELNFAELNDAELNDAELNFAKLNGAKIGTTSFKHADMRNCNRDDDAKIARMDVCEWPVTIQFDGIHIGCKTFTLGEIMNMTEEIAATHNEKAPIRWRRWGKAIQALAKATLEG